MRVRHLLVCPACRGELTDEVSGTATGAIAGAGVGLGCAACRVVYPIVDGVPLLVPEHARPRP